MAVLHFDGVDDYVRSVSTPVDLTGAISILAVIKLDATTGFRCIVSNNNDTDGAPEIAFEFNPSGQVLVYEVNAVTSVSSTTAIGGDTTNWWFVGFSKAAGVAVGRFHFKNLTTLAATIHEPATSTIGNAPSIGAGDIKIGNYGVALNDDYNGSIAMVSEFDVNLSDAQIDTVLASRTTSAVYALTPRLLVECTLLTPVDLVGATSFNAAVGATLTGPDPINWTLDGTGVAPFTAPAYVANVNQVGGQSFSPGLIGPGTDHWGDMR